MPYSTNFERRQSYPVPSDGDAPLGGLEVEIEDELLEIENGDEDPELDLGPPVSEFEENLADVLEEEYLQELADRLISDFKADQESRKDWEAIASRGIELLGFEITEMAEPFEGACGASHPVLAQAVVKFQAKAFRELFPPGGPVVTRIKGAQTPQKLQQAQRVREYMNFQTTQEMPEYGPELDRLLFYVGLFGSGFRKVYFDSQLGRPCARFIKADDFIIAYDSNDLQTSPRYTHRMYLSGNDIKRKQVYGEYRRIELSAPADPETNEVKLAEEAIHGITAPSYQDDETYTILEMHVDLSLPGDEHKDGLACPYVVAVDMDSRTILSVRRNWKEHDERYRKRLWFTHYCLIPGLGFYGYGFLHLIGGLAKTATASMRQLVDAGTFATLPAGFKSHGLRVLAPSEPLLPGEWREVNSPAGDLQKSLMPLPYKEPSATVMQLMDYVVSAARDFADSTDDLVANSTNYGPVGTTMALMGESGKLFSAIHMRLHAAQAQDLRILAELNFENLEEEQNFSTPEGQREIFRTDFDLDTVDVVPVSDPHMPTEAHRIAKLNAVATIASQAPAEHNMREIRMDLYRAMGVDNPERYMAQEAKPFTGDPISENYHAILGQPLTAEDSQPHDEHIKAHAMPLNNPAYAENPVMRQILGQHIADHLARKYRIEMLQAIGDPRLAQAILSGQKLPPELEAVVSMAAAEASDKVLAVDQLKAQAEQMPAPDPVAMKGLEIQEKEVEYNYDIANRKLMLEEVELMIDDVNTDLDREKDIRVAKIRESAELRREEMREKQHKRQTAAGLVEKKMDNDQRRDAASERNAQLSKRPKANSK